MVEIDKVIFVKLLNNLISTMLWARYLLIIFFLHRKDSSDFLLARKKSKRALKKERKRGKKRVFFFPGISVWFVEQRVKLSSWECICFQCLVHQKCILAFFPNVLQWRSRSSYFKTRALHTELIHLPSLLYLLFPVNSVIPLKPVRHLCVWSQIISQFRFWN